MVNTSFLYMTALPCFKRSLAFLSEQGIRGSLCLLRIYTIVNYWFVMFLMFSITAAKIKLPRTTPVKLPIANVMKWFPLFASNTAPLEAV